MSHVVRFRHQFRVVKEFKGNMTPSDIVFHVDFSENYQGQYHREIQSAYYGASKEQVTLHTGILQTVDETKGFLTLKIHLP